MNEVTQNIYCNLSCEKALNLLFLKWSCKATGGSQESNRVGSGDSRFLRTNVKLTQSQNKVNDIAQRYTLLLYSSSFSISFKFPDLYSPKVQKKTFRKVRKMSFTSVIQLLVSVQHACWLRDM